MKSVKLFAITAALIMLFSVVGTGLVFAENAEDAVVTTALLPDDSSESVEVNDDAEAPEEVLGEEETDAETDNKAVTEFKICVPEFIDSLKVMLIGLVGIFAVTGVIILCICLLNKFTVGKEE